MARHATWRAVFGRNAMARFIAAVVTAVVLGGTAVAETPIPAAQTRPLAPCEVVEHDGTIELAAVMQIITYCQDALALSEAQRERLGTLGIAHIDGVMRSEARRALVEGALASLLRPDPEDPGRPVDIAAAEAKIRELERIAADQDIATLRAVEASKAVLTAVQRARLAVLLATPRGAAAPKLVL
jgi:hypothetical protein